MPYITKKKRGLFDGYIREIINNINHYAVTDGNSMMAYIIYKLIMMKYNKLSWEIMSDALKVLEDVKLEFYRKVMVPYANGKIEVNGDIN